MIDLKIIQASVLLVVDSVTPIRNFRPPSVILIGTDLSKATEIYYNQSKAENFVVSASNRLIVQIPPEQVGNPLASLQVLSSVQASQMNALLSFNTSPPSTISGIERLIQAFFLVLMTTPGSDIFSPSSGGGVKSMVGRVSGNSLPADLALGVENTKAELLSLQANNQNIPPSERLLSATLSNVSFDSSSTTLSATIQLVNVLGGTAQVSVSG